MTGPVIVIRHAAKWCQAVKSVTTSPRSNILNSSPIQILSFSPSLRPQELNAAKTSHQNIAQMEDLICISKRLRVLMVSIMRARDMLQRMLAGSWFHDDSEVQN